MSYSQAKREIYQNLLRISIAETEGKLQRAQRSLILLEAKAGEFSWMHAQAEKLKIKIAGLKESLKRLCPEKQDETINEETQD